MNLKKILLTYLITFLFANAISQNLNGNWRGILTLDKEKGAELPFTFSMQTDSKKISIKIFNASEVILVDEITRDQDSLFIKMPLFDSEFRTKITGDSILTGFWLNHNRTDKNKIAFTAKKGITKRFDIPQTLDRCKFTGKWEVDFSKGTTDQSKAIALFEVVTGEGISGTFLTETGDYRFLEGVENDNKLFLSCFDGSHAFLFIADLKDGKIVNGKFFSGAHSFETWEGKRNDKFQLKDPEEITQLKKGFNSIAFSFKNTEGKLISLNDQEYKNKVVIVQLMGSWCPNCMDETFYLSDLYKRYQKKGLKIIALAFEKTNDFEKAKERVLRLKNKSGAEYEFLITTQIGKDKAAESLPMLNSVTAFPTTLFIDKKGKVKKIHTGFSGPGTGKEFVNFKDKTELFIDDLLLEK